MSPEEAGSIMKAKAEAEKNIWERTRLMCFYSVIAMDGTKNYKKPEDLFELSWDGKDSGEKERSKVNTPLSKDEVRLRTQSLKYNKNKKKLQ